MKNYTYKIGHYSNENAIALTVMCLNKEYPNVTFEAVEDGCGRYEVMVYSQYNMPISDKVLHVFKNVLWVLYKSIPVIIKIEKEL